MISRDLSIGRALMARRGQSRQLQRGFILPGMIGARYPQKDPHWANVSALIPMNGTNGSTTFTDLTGKTWTAGGNAQISTAQSVYGGSSGLFDGAGDYITTAANAAFGFGNGDYTVEGWIRQATNSINYCLFDNRSGVAQGIAIYVSQSAANYNFRLSVANNTGTIAGLSTAQFANNTWQHFSVQRASGNLYGHISGSIVWSTTDSRTLGASVAPYIGTNYGAAQGFNGNVNWMRITKGVARYGASNYSVPSLPLPARI